ncbi:MotE family protein [Chthonobacter rhizosphaerae]|uniref:MotE family protein n=1 Tax=Chthonobacter rhizosphaerae TaxID=2735553 RepID=UPI0015EE3BCE|nr:MotE family protein [Chthonobacter rhizosphaerae]
MHASSRRLSCRALVVLAVATVAPPALAADDVAVVEANDFCRNNAPVAEEIGRELQIRRLVLTEQRINARIEALKAATEETRRWLEQRDELLGKADDQLVEIYSRMRADAAAAQLSVLGNDLAVSLIMRLPPRAIGPIMNEMESGRAAALAGAVDRLRRASDANGGNNS